MRSVKLFSLFIPLFTLVNVGAQPTSDSLYLKAFNWIVNNDSILQQTLWLQNQKIPALDVCTKCSPIEVIDERLLAHLIHNGMVSRKEIDTYGYNSWGLKSRLLAETEGTDKTCKVSWAKGKRNADDKTATWLVFSTINHTRQFFTATIYFTVPENENYPMESFTYNGLLHYSFVFTENGDVVAVCHSIGHP